ncbi:putative modular polyketide synthase [Actinacidiphila reveromycinica]|uniref:Putative modular polyketide synthase n=1 Tax=Actinacidiphila reveromycinica TaxID=659352 RepID=A0A7U3V0K0_9ACTN|nr:type I polyketide synthase [Streptomyces sp. SN-593]BBB02252.1 putative modular polyketide synthase [Streptomyces sp. SN-593]
MSDEKLRYFLKRVTANLHETRQRLQEVEAAAGEPIAVVSMGCRYPGGVGSPEELWDLVASGTDAVGAFPQDRGWDVEGMYDPDPDRVGASYVRAGGFVYGAGDFDPGFFSISPREAAAMDPQQRLLLETSWEALERAGLDPTGLSGSRTGVFVGASTSGYGYGEGVPPELEGHLATGTASSVMSGRISYLLGLEGPAVTVDTACSSSLLAIHLACQALRTGECTMALAGGATVMTTPTVFVWTSRQRGLAADGRCKAFSADADGMGMAEGAGMILLERLSDARRNGHPVLAVIRGSAMNQDGASNGLTAPNGPSQEGVIRAALANARLGTGDVDAVEAHGTGTALGDPIEAQALLATYGQDRPEDRPLWLGSFKSNIGHAQQASGVAGVIKMVQALRHEVLPRTLHAEEPSPHVDWASGGVRLLNEPVEWRSEGRPRRAGVSAFGMSGTNVHLILEEPTAATGGGSADTSAGDGEGADPAEAVSAPEDGASAPEGDAADAVRRPLVTGLTPWPVSARSVPGLSGQTARLAAHVAARPELEPADVARSLATTRTSFEHRSVVIGSGPAELAAALGAATERPGKEIAVPGEPGQVTFVTSGVAGDVGRVVFVFPGQGAQWVGMGRELASCCGVFAERLAECGVALAPWVGWSLEDVIGGVEGAPGLERAEVVQPVLWAVMVSLAAVWEAAGVVPDAVVGHSQGEVAAATVAGMLSLEDAARVVVVRSRALSGLDARAGMVSVVMPEAAVREILEPWGDSLSIAAVNGPAATVVSGGLEALAEFEAELAKRRAMRWRVPDTDFVAHSARVEGLEPLLAAELAGIRPVSGRVPLYSTAESRWMDGAELDAGYWFTNVRRTVRFADAVAALAGSGHRTFIEVSPHPTLEAGVADTIDMLDAPGTNPPVVAGTLHRDFPAAIQILSVLARAWTRGVKVDWAAVTGPGRAVDLPTYAFQRERYWYGPQDQLGRAASGPRPARGADGGGSSAAEARFWAAVEGGDLGELAETLAVDGERSFREVLPALASWRREEREQSVTDAWRYTVDWAPIGDVDGARLSGTWVVVSPSPDAAAAGGMSGLAADCARVLGEHGARVVRVEAGAGEVGREALAVRVLTALSEAGEQEPAGVLSLLALAGDAGTAAFAEGPSGVPAALSGSLGLVQALGDAGIGAPLWTVTRGAVAAGPDDHLTDPVQGLVWGLGRVVALEHPERWGGLVDLPVVLDRRAGGRLAGVLAGCDEDQVAIRAAGVLARRLVRAARPARRDGAWVPSGTVLVTGGTGAIGGHVARWLAERGAPRVVLTSRSGAGAPDVAELAAAVAESGTAVEVVASDVARRGHVEAVLDRIGASGPRLSGVMHTAGVIDDGLLDGMDEGRLAGVLAAKAAGAAWLDELTSDLDLERFVLFSSAAATFGGAGQGNYAAANAYLDALALSRAGSGRAALSVAFGPWAGGGVAEANEAVRQRLRRGPLPEMDPVLAMNAFARAVDGPGGLVAVMDVDWTQFAAAVPGAADIPFLRDVPELVAAATAAAAAAAAGQPGAGAGPVGAADLAAQLTGATRAEQERVLTDLIRVAAADVLGHSAPASIPADRPFSDLGFDSLTTLEMRQQMSALTGLRLPATLLFDYPTPEVLAGFLRSELGVPAAGGDVAPAVAEPAAAGSGADGAALGEPVAIVAMSCRYPGGVTAPEDLWDLLEAGRDAIGGFPEDRGWDTGELDDGTGGSYRRAGGFVHDAGDFDPAFFSISPREATAMDPQQRLLLEIAWEALERAGINPRSLRGSSTGVFAGGAFNGYGIGAQFRGDVEQGLEGHLVTGTSTSVLSGRLSYVLGLEGPAVTVDTACSSSLVSLHLACQALKAGECDLALAGGVTIMAMPGDVVGFSRQRQMGLAADGRCKAFSADADGMGMAEGAGMLVLERLSDARRNGHEVLAVVRGSAINQDGASNGLTAPNGPSQQRVIRAALANARLSAADVDAVEAHGTGTELGDPIEAQALLATYGQDRPEGRPLLLGSVKSNIGHSQCAAGAAGVIKMVLALQHQTLPRTLHADEPSPYVDWSAGAVELLNAPVEWTAGDRPRRAGVSSFGMSGTNAHVVLEEAPAVEGSAVEVVGVVDGGGVPLVSGVVPWVVSGRSVEGLGAQAGRLGAFVADRPGVDVADVAWSLATSRAVFEHRAVLVGSSRDELAAGADSVVSGTSRSGVVSGVAGDVGRVVFVFPGQGAQWVGMGRELASSCGVFAERLAECGAALAPWVEWSLEDVIAGIEGAPGLERAEVVQPVLWAVMVSLAAVWEAAGVVPDAVVGHSQGEVAAATVAGMLSLEDAARVVVVRSRELSGLDARAGMVSVVMPEAAVREILEPWGESLSIAAVNGPAATVVSGGLEALAEFEGELARRRVMRWRVSDTDFVAHSALVEPLESLLAVELAGIRPVSGRVPLFSTAESRWVDGAELDAGYWYANVRRTVRFADAVVALVGSGHRAFVEVSPQPVLGGAVEETVGEVGGSGVVVTGTLSREGAGGERLVASLAALWVAGGPVDWRAVVGGGRRVELPTYAFQHQRYWTATPESRTPAGGDGALSPAESGFWAAVENGDLAELATTLSVDGERPLREVLPALASWRRQERGRFATDAWRYRTAWERLAEPVPARLTGTWLAVVPAGSDDADGATGLVADCVRVLGEHGARVVRVEVGSDELDREALAVRVLTALSEAGETAPAGVVSLLGLVEGVVPGLPGVSVGVLGAQVVVQGLADAGVGAPVWLVTCGAVAAVPGEGVVRPVQSLVWGLGRVAALEVPERWGGVVDLPVVWDGRAAARWVGVLAAGVEDQVAVRVSGVWGRRLVRAARPVRRGAGWVPSGTVLVTGGTGAIGGHSARWLAGRGAPRVVLVSRSGPGAVGVAGLVAGVASAGSAVEVVSADVADRSGLEGLLGRIGAGGPALCGVLHTAGLVQNTPLEETDAAEMAEVLAAKAEGARLLDELTAGLPLEQFVVFSSIAATWGSAMQPAYAAANTYLEALAEHRRGRGLPATSVAWGPWGGGGMTDAEGGRQLRRRGLPVMDPALLVSALASAIDTREDHRTVADVDWATFAPPYTLRRPSPLLSGLPEVVRVLAAAEEEQAGSAEGGAELRARLAGLAVAEQERLLTDLIRATAAPVLGHSGPQAIEPGRAFSDLGFDSLTAVELRNQLTQATGLRLPATLLFDHPTPAVAARFLLAELTGAVGDTPEVPVTAAAAGEPIAVVAMGCRYPGGITSPEELWDLVVAGTDAVGAFPQDRGWDVEGMYDPDPDRVGSSYVRTGGFVYGAGDFDPAFFGISPREALAMDPQQRLLLETSWEALERAGIDPGALRGSSTGVFVGASSSGYGFDGGLPAELEGHLSTGMASSVMSGRVSYLLGLEGPAVTVDTACSSALVALHLACQALRSGECTMALAGGVTVMATPTVFILTSRQRGLAADGRCKAFSADADGMGMAEGAGMLVLERLSEARRNGHPVLAVIRGSAMNQDGASNGLTAPNGPAQQRVIRAALASAQVGGAEVDAVEAHGTGTALGDPIEAQALLATYGQEHPDDRPLWLGSLKSNIGHAQQASGVAGVIKMVQALQHRLLPRTLHAEEPSPHVDWASGAVRLLNEPVEWRSEGRPRRAGVSAFGMSGTNVHVILEESPAGPAAPADGDDPAVEGPAVSALEPALEPAVAGGEYGSASAPHRPLVSGAVPWVISARSAEGVVAQAARLRDAVAGRSEEDAPDLAWSLATSRSVFEHRAVLVGRDWYELTAGVDAVASGRPWPGLASGVAADMGRVVFVFPGQGAQWVGMGRELASCCGVFAERLAECGVALAPWVGWSLEDVIAGVEGAPGLERAEVVQPVLWAVMVSLAAVWEAAGVVPDAVVGHSQGEVAAATVAGMLSLEDAARVVVVRSRALSGLGARAGMVSVVMPEAAVREILEPWGESLSIAAVNGPAATVVSGGLEALAEFEAELAKRRAMRWRVPDTDFVAHSARVESLEPLLAAELADIRPASGHVPLYSTAESRWMDGAELDAGYWFTNVRRTVRFADAVEVLASEGHRTFIEVSPHPTLEAGVADTIDMLDAPGTNPPVVSGTLHQESSGAAQILTVLSRAFARGVAVDWAAVLGGGQRVDLPTYAFQRERYWYTSQPPTGVVRGGDGAVPPGEARFWAAVEGGDLGELAATLAVDGERSFREVLPALASWRREEREQSVTDAWRYTVDWAPVGEPDTARLSGTWLLVVPAPDGERGGADPLAAACGQVLGEHGARVVRIEVAPEELARDALAVRVLTALSEAGEQEPAGVLSLLALAGSTGGRFADGSGAAPAGLSGTLGVVQALGDAGIGAPLWTVTCGAVAAAPGETLENAAQGMVWGLGRVAALEHPERWGGLVDLPPVLDRRAGARLAGVLAGGDEDQVAVRPAGVLARRLVRAARPARRDGAWVPSGTILVTGGTGAIGGHVARWLAERGAPRVVLTSRSGPSAADVAELAAALAGSGTAAEVVSADVAARHQVASLLDRVGASGPRLSGVMHTAGVIDDGLLDGMDEGRLAGVLAAKAAGAAWLDELTSDLDLERFVLFSSAAATFGGAGQGNYAAANAYLDALALSRAGSGRAALSVAFGPWAGGGVAEANEAVRQRLRRGPLPEMDPVLAMNAFARAVDGPGGLVAVMDVDWTQFAAVPGALDVAFVRDVPELAAAAASAAAAAAGQNTAGAAPVGAEDLVGRLTGVSRAEQDRVLTDLIRSAAAEVLGHGASASVPADRPFSDLGFDSLTTLEMRQQMSALTGLRLPATLLFDYPTPEVLAGFLRVELGVAAAGDGPDPAVSGAASAVAGTEPDEPVAIVAMSCRYPGGVASPEDLWEVLSTGRDAIGGFPRDRGWDTDDLYDPEPGRPGSVYVRAGGFVHDAGDFDPAFFSISPREALAMDPQQRILLEIAWEALERAGLDPRALRGTSTGVFVGGYSSGYGLSLVLQGSGQAEGHLMTGNAGSVLSGRLSYAFGLEGPAVTVDTACSSSLVTLHLACQALKAGECDLALAGGVTIMANPMDLVEMSRQRGLAADGRCKAFSASADGMGMAEGAGMIVLERLSDARRNGHHVLAVVAGSAVNQDGASNGLTAPNGPSQQRVIRAALASARLSAADIDAVEAHGTGTELGDPIEAQALLATYGQDRPADRPLLLGSVKSNIGHTQAAAGAAGVIKMVLALQHRTLPRTLHADEPSPHVDWSAGEVRLLNDGTAWPAEGGRPRRAGVSAFGVSGTNAHVVLAEAPAVDGADTADGDGAGGDLPAAPPVLAGATASAGAGAHPASGWLLSARTAEGLAAQAARVREFASTRPESAPADVAWSLATTRSTFEHRAVVTGSGRDDLLAGLAAVAAGVPAAGVVSGEVPADGDPGRIAFVFPGQGSQWAGMGAELARVSPVFAARLDECETALAPFVDWSLREVLAEGPGAPGLDRVDVVQPALWAVLVSLAAVWQAAGVIPDAVVGHSQGEIAAAVVAGVLSLEDGARVVALRSQALRALAGRGGMMSIAAGEEAVRARIASYGERVSVAALNGPAATVVSGDPEALEELAAACEADGVRARVLPVDYASHSPQVEELEAQIRGALDGLAPRRGTIPVVSSMTGGVIDGTAMDAGYWYDSLRAPVRFGEAVATLAGSGHGVFVETSPHPVLTGAVADTVEAAVTDADEEGTGGSGAVVTGTLRREDGGAARLLASLAEAHVRGVRVDWAAVLPAGRRVDLPTYAFQHQRYWPEVSLNLDLGALRGPGGGPRTGGGAAEARFWAAVEGEDLGELASTLAVDDHERLRSVLPALASWRHRERDESALASWRYRIDWTPVTDPGPATLSGLWLVMTPGAEAVGPDLAEACAEALGRRGARVAVVEAGAADLDRAALAGIVGQAVAAAHHDGDGTPPPAPAGVLSLLALDGSPLTGHPHLAAGPARTQTLVQALGDLRLGAPVWAVTRGAVATDPAEAAPDPVQAQVWGMGRVAGLEHPDWWGGLVDLPPAWDERVAGRLCALLAGCGEDQAAIRPAGIMARRLVRAPLPAGGARPWHTRGTALVTGGTGAIGGRTARWLAGRGSERIVLAGRSGPAAPQVAALAADLAGRGADVDVVACDVARRDETAGLLERIASRGPALRAVLHAAGAPQSTALEHTDHAELAAVLAAKAAGAAHLDALTADADLDAFVLFSSAAATWGSGMQPGYAAANAFLDALAENRRSRGLPGTAVAWGLWGGGGMGAGEGGRLLERHGVLAMEPDLLVRSLERALAGGEGALTVADVDWQRFAPPFTLRRPSPLIADLPEVRQALAGGGEEPDAGTDTAAGGKLGRELADLSRTEQDRALVRIIRSEAAAVLGYPSPDSVPAARPFRDLGFDSLTAVELRNHLTAATGLRLPATLVFDYPTPADLAAYVWGEVFGREPESDTVVEELDRVDSLLSGLAPDSAAYDLVNRRLQEFLAKWSGAGRGGGEVAKKISAASDDALFDFIDKQFGRS